MDLVKLVGFLIGLSDSDDWWEELLLCHPVFRARIAGARRGLREGRGMSLEALRDRWGEKEEGRWMEE